MQLCISLRDVFWRQNVDITDRSFSAFLKEDIISMCQTVIDSFKQKLLFLENVDYIYLLFRGQIFLVYQALEAKKFC